MSKTKFLISLVLAVSILVGQVGEVLAAPTLQDSAPITGTVQSITIETDPNTGIITVIVQVASTDQSTLQDVHLSQKTAEKLGLVVPDSDGNPVINNSALGRSIEIKRSMIIPVQEVDRHPIGNLLEELFADSTGVNYAAIMDAHEEGVGFGVIAQALWLTKQVHGNADTFSALLSAKQNNDYTDLPFVILDENGIPITFENWGQLRKAIADGNKIKKVGSNPNSENKDKGKGKSKDKNNGNNGNNGSNDNSSGGSDKNNQKNK